MEENSRNRLSLYGIIWYTQNRITRFHSNITNDNILNLYVKSHFWPSIWFLWTFDSDPKDLIQSCININVYQCVYCILNVIHEGQFRSIYTVHVLMLLLFVFIRLFIYIVKLSSACICLLITNHHSPFIVIFSSNSLTFIFFLSSLFTTYGNKSRLFLFLGFFSSFLVFRISWSFSVLFESFNLYLCDECFPCAPMKKGMKMIMCAMFKIAIEIATH